MKRNTRRQLALVLLAGSPALLLAQRPQQRVAAPVGVAVTSNATALAITWQNVANAGSYNVNRREGTQVVALATVRGSPYSGPLPTAGTRYEYQVAAIGSGKNNVAASQWIPYTIPITAPTPGTGGGVVITEPRPGGPGGTIKPIVVPAGPTSLTASSGIPGQIVLVWRAVTGATAYRITRSSSAPEAEATLTEKGVEQFWSEGGLFNFTHAPVDERFVHTYKVFALIGGTLSQPSPAASASSAPFVQPTGLKYTAAPSTTKLGTLNVTLSWNAVANAEKYNVMGTGFTGQAFMTTSSTSIMFPGLPPKTTITGICVSTVFPFTVTTTQGAPCVDIRL